MRIERWLYTVPLRLQSLFRRKQVEIDLNDELHFHIEQRIAWEIEAGKSPNEARALALRAMEGVEQQKENCRDARRVALFENRVRDLRYSLRALRLSPGFTAAAVITLALGIGANTAIFSLIDTVLLKMLPVKAPQQLFLIGQRLSDHVGVSWSYPDYCAMRDHGRMFEGIIGYDAYPEPMGVQSGNGSEEVAHGIFVTGNYFGMLGVPAALGRVFNSADDYAPGAAPYVVLSYSYWQSRFNSDASVIGHKLRINGYPFTVAEAQLPAVSGCSGPSTRRSMAIVSR